MTSQIMDILLYATTTLLIIILATPCQSIALARPRGGDHHSVQRQRNRHGNTEEIQVFLPAAGSQGQYKGPGFMSQDPETPIPAFSAHRLAGMSISTASENITYDKEELDTTDAFEPTKGYFQCQVPGLYYFSFTFWARSKIPLKIRLQQNGITKAALFVGRGTFLKQASQSALLMLKRHEKVWLEAYSPSIITPSSTPINVFNGYLIQAIK